MFRKLIALVFVFFMVLCIVTCFFTTEPEPYRVYVTTVTIQSDTGNVLEESAQFVVTVDIGFLRGQGLGLCTAYDVSFIDSSGNERRQYSCPMWKILVSFIEVNSTNMKHTFNFTLNIVIKDSLGNVVNLIRYNSSFDTSVHPSFKAEHVGYIDRDFVIKDVPCTRKIYLTIGISGIGALSGKYYTSWLYDVYIGDFVIDKRGLFTYLTPDTISTLMVVSIAVTVGLTLFYHLHKQKK